MSVFERFLLILYTLGIIVGLFVVGLAVAGWTTPVEAFQAMLLDRQERIIIGIITALFLIISIKFFLQALARENRPVQAVVHETGMGQVRVSSEAVENLVHRVAAQIRGIRDVKPRIACTPEGINIFLRVTLSPEINIPEITDELQKKISDYLSEVAGINVLTVKVLVENIATESKPGTPRKLM